MPISLAWGLAAWAWLLGARACGATPGVVAVSVPVLVASPGPSAQRHLKIAASRSSGLLEQAAKRLQINLGEARRKAQAEEEDRNFALGTALINAAEISVAPAVPAAEPAVTTPLPTGLPAIAYRFQLIQRQMFVLANDISQAQKNISLIDAAVTSDDSSMQIADKNLTTLVNISAQNTNLSWGLESNATVALELVDKAHNKMKGLKKKVDSLKEVTSELSDNADELKEKVEALDNATDAMLPGVGTLSKKMGAVEGTITSYTKTSEKDLDEIVSKSLKASFQRAVNRLHEMTDETLKAKR